MKLPNYHKRYVQPHYTNPEYRNRGPRFKQLLQITGLEEVLSFESSKHRRILELIPHPDHYTFLSVGPIAFVMSEHYVTQINAHPKLAELVIPRHLSPYCGNESKGKRPRTTSILYTTVVNRRHLDLIATLLNQDPHPTDDLARRD